MNLKHPAVYIIGSGTPDDDIKVLKLGLQKGIIDTVFSSVVLGLLFMVSQDYDLGKETINLLKDKVILTNFKGQKTYLLNTVRV